MQSIEALVKKKAEARKIKYKQGKQLRGVHLRKHLHFLVAAILKMDEHISKEKIVILKDEHNTNGKNARIYACNHIGGNDIQRVFQVIKEPAYLMLSDPGILYRMPIYYGLMLNGVIPLETTDAEDRKIAYRRAVELLEKGGNLLIFPEGAWNVTPNLPIMKTFTGTVRMAQETGCEIVPIAVQQYGNTFYFNIGENYLISKYSEKPIEKLNAELRDRLATLAWEIMASFAPVSRSEIPAGYVDSFQAEIVNRCNFGYGFTLQDAINESFHDKTITNYSEAFAHLAHLIPCKENAFLFRDRRQYRGEKV